ncbi:MAG: DNA-3-methyladenine glycosylase I [Erysipelotrichaceae bacterium]|nr:DNA-3-methyladenine glycosylase I [Erysipelotrichaceae bacterium]
MCNRCKWVNLKNPLYVAYHDHEWSQAEHDDGKLFELLILEGFQAGLSWECILNKREAFRAAFDHFDINTVSGYSEDKVGELMRNEGIVRNRRKILAAIQNAKAFLKIQEEYGSFDAYLWHFTNRQTVKEPYYLRTTSPLSDEISKDLKQRGMKFVGSTIIYSYLQACGIYNAHGEECDLCE